MPEQTQVTVGQVVAAMEQAYPPHLAESWDAVGLICGDRTELANKVAFALDCTDEVTDAAIEANADMLIVHHPLLLRGVTGVPADSPKGRIIHKLIRNNVALFAAHTNADSARPGVNDRLAELLGVHPGRPLKPIPQGIDKWGVTVPGGDADTVKSAIFATGAGTQGDYEQAGFEFAVTGQFKPVGDASPHIGTVGEVEKVEEVRVEFTAPSALRHKVREALCAAHPYEEPAYDVVELQTFDSPYGIGRVGELDEPMAFREFVARVADRLPKTRWGVRGAGDPERVVRTVAVASGAGDSFLTQVAKMDVDCFVTSDLRHHPVDEHLRMGGCPVIDTAHWASEFPWCAQAADVVHEATGAEVHVIDIPTDPWTLHEQ
ncbi:MAG TPA: Nif3-like dinuclear metal center hexameric protein [Candidatus Corynebacterium gallistercoris]|uniref:GTP cyclohydrolase 1 type 2 homolog n=1 Tax=Candidatus Corynebacterium gallistercoris TaxID=2838530 RepID=A0A9D1RZT5_9CORY|nr:Nif3-like dinuclear metal center hexameric protein [Candidatus Corynebacterium gallistercoris]